MFRWRLIYSTLFCTVRVKIDFTSTQPDSFLSVRFMIDEKNKASCLPKTPFTVTGAPNVVLDTIKRGDDDDPREKDWKKGSSTVILRLYEAFGGHANARINIASNVNVSRATVTNLLEDDIEALDINKMITDSSSEEVSYVDVNLRGFQVLTVKLVISSASWDLARHSRYISYLSLTSPFDVAT